MGVTIRAAGTGGELDGYGYCAWCYELEFDPPLSDGKDFGIDFPKGTVIKSSGDFSEELIEGYLRHNTDLKKADFDNVQGRDTEDHPLVGVHVSPGQRKVKVCFFAPCRKPGEPAPEVEISCDRRRYPSGEWVHNRDDPPPTKLPGPRA